MNRCPCCSNTLLKHWKQQETYWYCIACRQEMPNWQFTDLIDRYQQKSKEIIQQFALKETIVSPHTHRGISVKLTS